MKRSLASFLTALLLTACETTHKPRPTGNAVDTTAATNATGYYSNFRAFTDSLLHRDEVTFTGEKIEVTAGAGLKKKVFISLNLPQ